VVPGGSYHQFNRIEAKSAATLSDFRLDKYEVTVGRIRKFVEGYDTWRASGHPKSGESLHSKITLTGWDSSWNAKLPTSAALFQTGLNCQPANGAWSDTPGVNESLPASCITWYEAFAFCAWDGGRLPTEAETDYATVGGDEQRMYPWGSMPPGNNAQYAAWGSWRDGNSAQCTLQDTAPVGSIPAGNGRFGQADLTGNVGEWVFDAYLHQGPCNDCASTDLSSGLGRLAVGSFACSKLYDANIQREQNGIDPGYAGPGLRCARNIQ